MTWRRPLPMGWLLGADALAAVTVAAFALYRAPSPTPAVWGAVVAIAVALPLRRLRPLPVLLAELIAAASAIVIGVPGDPVVLAVALALYPVAVQHDRRRSAVAFGLSLASVVLPGLTVLVVDGLPLVGGMRNEDTVVPGSITVVAYGAVVVTSAWALGRLVRGRRADTEALIVMRERHAIAEERLRIARDVHDIVGHSLSVITMKAAVAEHLAADRPEEGRAALATIEQVGRSALADVRSVLAGLRQEQDDSPDLAGIDDLVGAAEAAGLEVEYRRPMLGDVPSTVQASAYRIVQEALTNAAKHARPQRCSVVVDRDPDVLTISVVNPIGGRSGPAVQGLGLVGMSERVASTVAGSGLRRPRTAGSNCWPSSR